MSTTTASSISNAAPENLPFISCWNELLTPKWVRFRHLLSGNGQIHSDVAYPTLPLRAGDRVLDVGCGFGENTLELAERVGPAGSAVGIDCTKAFLDIARREQIEAEIPNVSYLLADVQTADLEAQSFDAAVSRFGITFCASTVGALRNLRRALRPGGVLGLVCWRGVSENPCWAAPEALALSYLPLPGEDGQTCGPGPFAMADAETNERMLHAAGFEQVRHRRIDRAICMGNDLDEAVQYQLMIGPAGYVVREAGARADACREPLEAELRALLSHHQRDDGSVWMESSTWFITARTPR